MKQFFLFLIRIQRAMAPFWRSLLGGAGPCCRFHPTCSAYAEEAIERYGVVRGIRLAFARVLRCHPWGRSGWDPVKESA